MCSLLLLLLLHICTSSSSSEEETTATNVQECLGTEIRESSLAMVHCQDLDEMTEAWLDDRYPGSLKKRADDDDEDLLQTNQTLQTNRQTNYVLREGRTTVGTNEIVTTTKPLMVYGFFPEMLCKDWSREFRSVAGASLGQEYGCVARRVRGEAWAAACSFRNYVYSS